MSYTFSVTGGSSPAITYDYSATFQGALTVQGAAGVGAVITGASTIAGTLGVTGALQCGSPVQLPYMTVATLPAASSANVGCIAYIHDATATTRYSTVAGGGSNGVVVFSNGSSWLIL